MFTDIQTKYYAIKQLSFMAFIVVIRIVESISWITRINYPRVADGAVVAIVGPISDEEVVSVFTSVEPATDAETSPTAVEFVVCVSSEDAALELAGKSKFNGRYGNNVVYFSCTDTELNVSESSYNGALR